MESTNLILLLWAFLSTFSLYNATNFTVICPRECSCVAQTISCYRFTSEAMPKLPLDVPGEDGGTIQFITVHRSPIVRIEPNAFEGFVNLKSLDLSYNQIVWISSRAFFGLPSLRILRLKGNRLAHIPAHVFSPVFLLEELDLSQNELQRIPFSVEGLVYLKRLVLSENPLHCHCKLVDLAVSLIRIEPDRSRAVCRSPAEVSNMQLADLGRKLILTVNNTRLLGFQAIPDSMRAYTIHSHPYVPRPEEIMYGWPWGHCPIQDFGGFDSKRALMEMNHLDQADEGIFDEAAYRKWEIDTMNNRNGFGNWRDVPQDIEVIIGDVARFACGVVGDPTMQIMWIVPENARKFIRLRRRRQILEISEVHDYHEGVYTCVIGNRPGHHMHSQASLRILQPIKPRITNAPPADNNQIVEHSVMELTCSAYGRSRPQIFWLWKAETMPQSLVTSGRYIVQSDLQRHDLYTIYETTQHIIEHTKSTDTNSVLTVRNVTKEDARGRYICYAANRIGTAQVSTVIQIVKHQLQTRFVNTTAEPLDKMSLPKSDGNMTQKAELDSLKGDALVKRVIELARVRIEAAIKKTAEKLRKTNRKSSSADIASLFRQPSQAALELAKAAEVYEAALDEVTSIFRQRNQHKLELNGSSENTADESSPHEDVHPHSREALGVKLTTDQLAIISQLSGCQESVNINPCFKHLCFHLRYRSVDGSCNNFNSPRWGAALTPFRRLLPPQYENGINTPIGWSATKTYFGFPKPSARLVSRELLGNATLMSKHKQMLESYERWKKEKIHNQSEGNFPSISQYEVKSGKIFDEDDKLSGMLFQWGQFLDHDLDFTPVDASTSRFSDGLGCNETCVNDPPCFPILVPPNDPRIRHQCIGFARSTATCGSGSTSILLGRPHHREQLNQITAFIDASNVYGSEDFDNSQLRETLHDEGQMRTGMPTKSGKRLLPFNIRGQVDCQADPQQDFVSCFKAGDHRSNENLGLLSMHTLWVREHNRVADQLRTLNPDWFGDRIYHEARKIVGACMQVITYNAWLPLILGPKGMQLMGNYTGYDDQMDPSISNEFATAAMRFGHTLVPPVIYRLDENWNSIPEGHLLLHQAFFAPERMLKDNGMDPIIRGLLFNGVRDRTRNPPLNAELTERLFAMAHELALDLAALNVQRGRDHGIPGYTEISYRVCSLGTGPHPDSFDDLETLISCPVAREKLRMVYGHPGNIDLFTGGILEDLLPGARVGPTFACIIADQFKRLRAGDRMWFEASGVFTSAQITEIKRAGSSLARIICENGDNITQVPMHDFVRPKGPKELIDCSIVPKLNMAAWADCAVNPTSSIDSISVRRRRSISLSQHPYKESSKKSCTKPVDDQGEAIKRLIREIELLKEKINELSMKVNNATA